MKNKILISICFLGLGIQQSDLNASTQDDRAQFCNDQLSEDINICQLRARADQSACTDALRACYDSCLIIGLVCRWNCEEDYYGCIEYIPWNEFLCTQRAFQSYFRCMNIDTEKGGNAGF